MRKLSFLLLALLVSQSAFAQAKRKVRKDAGTSTSSSETNSSGLFPDWPTSDFDWFAGPVIGFKYSDVSADNQPRTKTTTFEGGLTAGLSGIPIVPGNPGFQFAPDVGAAFGYNFSTSKDEDGKTQRTSGHYRRQWIGLGETVYVHFFRYHLDLRYGRLTNPDDPDAIIQSQKIGNDFGFLILPWLSGHYTLNYLRGYTHEYADKFLEDYDHWIHARMFFNFMSFMVDLGPGFTQTTEYDIILHGKLANGRTDYFLMKLALNPFWKFVADGQAKYVYNATEENLGTYSTTRLPEDELSEPTTLAMPEDSFLGSLFLGVKDIAYGIGAGWRQNIQVLNVRRKNDADKQTIKDQGFGLYYEVRF